MAEADELCWYKVHYSIATYEGTVEVRASVDAEREHVVGLAKAKLRDRSGSLPFGAESFRIERIES